MKANIYSITSFKRYEKKGKNIYEYLKSANIIHNKLKSGKIIIIMLNHTRTMKISCKCIRCAHLQRKLGMCRPVYTCILCQRAIDICRLVEHKGHNGMYGRIYERYTMVIEHGCRQCTGHCPRYKLTAGHCPRYKLTSEHCPF